MSGPADATPPQPADVPAAVPGVPAAGADPTVPTDALPADGQPRGLTSHGRAQRTRISWVWIGLAAAAVVLILLIIFIAQNTRQVTIHYLGFSGDISIGLALLIAAICGVVIALIPGSIRILQLRRSVRRLAAERGGHAGH